MKKKSRKQRLRERARDRVCPASFPNPPEDEDLLEDADPSADIKAIDLSNLPPRSATERTMAGLFGGMSGPRDRKREAQDLAYAAMEAPSAKKAAELAQRALAIDPDCVDAHLIVAETAGLSLREWVERLREIVAIGERSLGRKFFQENRGHFWGLLETRPYMRARAMLAQALGDTGRSEEAIHEYEAALDLNPNDNQGLRYPLLGMYLAAGRLDGAGRLFQQYEDEGSAMFAWARVLERWASGDQAGAAAALREARESNRHVEKYLVGLKRMPRQLPGYYGFGDENEAVVCMACLGSAWQRHRGAREWLKHQTAGRS